jgi:hypothetical protein
MQQHGSLPLHTLPRHGDADRGRLLAAIAVVLGPVTAIKDANAHSNASLFACAIRCRAQLSPERRKGTAVTRPERRRASRSSAME